MERVPTRRQRETALRYYVRKQLELPWLLRKREPLDRSKIPRSAAFVELPERPHVGFVAPRERAPDLHAPALHRVALKVQLRKRNAEFRGPSERVHVRGPFPHRVERGVAVHVIALHAERIELEPDAGLAVVIGIEHECDLVRRVVVQQLISAHQQFADAVGCLAVVHAGADVDRAGVEQDAHLRSFRRRLAFVRRLLMEIDDRLGGGPCGVVQLSIDDDRFATQGRVRNGPWIVLRCGRGGRRGRRRLREKRMAANVQRGEQQQESGALHKMGGSSRPL